MEKYASTLGFGGILAGSLIVAIDAVALAPSLPTIADSLNASSIETYWAGVAYTLGSACFVPLFPATSNTFGRRPVSLFALAMFVIGTIVCGTAPNVDALLAGRTIQGIGGGGIVGMMYVVMADLFDMRGRAKALAINGLFWLVGTGTGPIIGGGFSSHASWRWIFWIVLPINGIAILLVAAFLVIPKESLSGDSPRGHKASQSRFQSLSTIDYAGSVWLVLGLAAFLVPLTWGGVLYDWSSWHTLVPLILGIVGIASWLVYEFFVPRNPILPLVVLNDRTVAIAFIGTLATGIFQFAVVFYLPLYFQIVKGYSALISGVALLPTTLGAAPATIITGMLISKIGRYKVAIIIAWALMALSAGLMTLMDVSTTPAQWVFIILPVGLGFGIATTSITVASQAPVNEEHMALTSGMSAFVRAIGQSIGLAIGNAMVQNGLKRRLQDGASTLLKDNADLIARNVASKKLLAGFMRNPADATELLTSYVGALKDVWWLLCALGLACMLLSLFIRDVSLDQGDQAGKKAESVSQSSASDVAEKRSEDAGSQC